MPNEDPVVWLAPLVGAMLALPCLWRAYVVGWRERLVANLPTCRTTGVFIGMVELEGTAETDRPFVSYLAEEPCVLYTWSVQESWSRTVTETYTDSKGRTQTRTRTESGWTTVASGGDDAPFFLVDDEGEILVRPEGAKIESETVFSEYCGRGSDLYYAKGPRGSVANSDHRRHFVEHAIPLGADIYVIGRAREREDVVAAEIAADPEADLFLISTRSQKAVRRSHGIAYWAWTVFGGVLATAGWVVADMSRRLPPEQRWPYWVLAAACVGLFLSALWMLLSYNALIDLSQRVEAAWRQVDIQLQRRATLIPSLVAVVRAMKDHEHDVQEALAAMRAQLAATPPGESGPDHHAIASTVQVLAERYPTLTADVNFRALQEQLVDTEQRIALARGYSNEIATHFNTRLETVPERWVAALAGLKRRELIRAEAFEREAVRVEVGSEEAGWDSHRRHGGQPNRLVNNATDALFQSYASRAHNHRFCCSCKLRFDTRPR
ncbi:MAG: LemA family protein [Planctomycetota bacterium]